MCLFIVLDSCVSPFKSQFVSETWLSNMIGWILKSHGFVYYFLPDMWIYTITVISLHIESTWQCNNIDYLCAVHINITFGLQLNFGNFLFFWRSLLYIFYLYMSHQGKHSQGNPWYSKHVSLFSLLINCNVPGTGTLQWLAKHPRWPMSGVTLSPVSNTNPKKPRDFKL